jgi:hypothetical protein
VHGSLAREPSRRDESDAHFTFESRPNAAFVALSVSALMRSAAREMRSPLAVTRASLRRAHVTGP